MCGIAGIFDARAAQAELEERTAAMTDTLVHRGPDDRGVLAGDGWALGMRRLAIIDLTPGGHQPMRRGALTIVYNGELYNYRELRRELEAAGRTFSSRSDTEVLLSAFEHWGPACLPRLNGMFALCIVDAARRRAWLARDRFGKKPLFVAAAGGRLAFASELKALFALGWPAAEIDRVSLAQFFRYQYVPGPRSILRGVQKLLPGTYVEFQLDRPEPGGGVRYWEPPPLDAAATPASPREVVEVVQEAVRRRLVADVPLGAFLSGGTDSSLVVACMARAAADVRTFSIGFRDPALDESHYARGVARHLGTQHTEHFVDDAEALAIVPELPSFYDEPFADSSAIPTVAVSRLARRHVTVALSGDGGDELFSGYLRYRYAPFVGRMARLPGALSRASGLLARLPGRASRLGWAAQLAGASPGTSYRETMSIWRSWHLRRLIDGADEDDGFAARFDAMPGSIGERMMRMDSQTYLVDDILQKVDRASMSVSLEARNPLLDPDVVALAARSVGAVGNDLGGKPLLRAALRELLPAELVDRPKKGFGAPVAAWLRGPLRPLVEDLVLARRDAEYSLDEARRVCRAHLDGRIDASPRVWSLLMLELWRERWLAPGAAQRGERSMLSNSSSVSERIRSMP